MNSFKAPAYRRRYGNWVADGANVYMVSDGKRELFCTLSKGLLTPTSAAEAIAAALNEKFAK
jgi:hypothetical protein